MRRPGGKKWSDDDLEDLLDFAAFLNVLPESEPGLLHLVAAAMTAPCPEGWLEVDDDEGNVYYHHAETNEVRPQQWHSTECSFGRRRRVTELRVLVRWFADELGASRGCAVPCGDRRAAGQAGGAATALYPVLCRPVPSQACTADHSPVQAASRRRRRPVFTVESGPGGCRQGRGSCTSGGRGTVPRRGGSGPGGEEDGARTGAAAL